MSELPSLSESFPVDEITYFVLKQWGLQPKAAQHFKDKNVSSEMVYFKHS